MEPAPEIVAESEPEVGPGPEPGPGSGPGVEPGPGSGPGQEQWCSRHVGPV